MRAEGGRNKVKVIRDHLGETPSPNPPDAAGSTPPLLAAYRPSICAAPPPPSIGGSRASRPCVDEVELEVEGGG